MESNYFQIIGKKIQSYRRQKDITQEELAKKLNISTVSLSRIERGKVKISLQKLIDISVILNIGIEKLLIENTIISVGEVKYVSAEFEELLKKCNSKQQKFIYQIAELVVDMNIK